MVVIDGLNMIRLERDESKGGIALVEGRIGIVTYFSRGFGIASKAVYWGSKKLMTSHCPCWGLNTVPAIARDTNWDLWSRQ